jgi:hypothetical protein
VSIFLKPIFIPFFQGDTTNEDTIATRELIAGPGGNVKQFLEQDLAGKQRYIAVRKVKSVVHAGTKDTLSTETAMPLNDESVFKLVVHYLGSAEPPTEPD